MYRVTARRARRKGRGCDDCRRDIEVGDLYVEHVTSPDHDDIGNTRWVRNKQCDRCACGTRCELFIGMSGEQHGCLPWLG